MLKFRKKINLFLKEKYPLKTSNKKGRQIIKVTF